MSMTKNLPRGTSLLAISISFSEKSMPTSESPFSTRYFEASPAPQPTSSTEAPALSEEINLSVPSCHHESGWCCLNQSPAILVDLSLRFILQSIPPPRLPPARNDYVCVSGGAFCFPPITGESLLPLFILEQNVQSELGCFVTDYGHVFAVIILP